MKAGNGEGNFRVYEDDLSDFAEPPESKVTVPANQRRWLRASREEVIRSIWVHRERSSLGSGLASPGSGESPSRPPGRPQGQVERLEPDEAAHCKSPRSSAARTA